MGTEQKFYGWKLVGALWVIYFLNMGFPLYAGAIINSYMLKDIVMDRATYGLGFTLCNLCTGGLSVVVALAVAKWEVRKTFLIGSFLLIVGALSMVYWASQPWHYLLGFGILMGSGMSFGCVVPATTTCTRWFTRFRGRAIAIVLTASGFGGLLGAPLINKFLALNGGDWRQAWLFVAIIAVVAGIITYLFVKERPEELGQVPDGTPAVNPVQKSAGQALHSKYDWTPSEVFRTRAFWLVLVGVIACKVPFFFFTAHGVLHAKGVGISPADAALLMGLYTMGGIPGRLIGGWLMDKMTSRYVFMLGLCCYIIGYLMEMYVSANSVILAYIAAIFIGAGFGWTFVVVNTIPGHYYGPKSFAKINGTFITASSVLSSPIGLIGGMLFDTYKSYTVAFWFCIATCVVGIIALLFAKMPQPPVVKPQAAAVHEL
jgi:MFS family permease